MSTYSRVRTQGSITTPIILLENWNITSCANRAPNSASYTAGWFQGYKRTMWDNNVAGWWKRKGKQFVFNDMLMTEQEYKVLGSSSFTLTVVAPCTSPTQQQTDTQTGPCLTRRVGWFTMPVNGPGVPSTTIDSLVGETWTSCLAKRGEGKANLLESLAELEKTFAMVRAPFENLSMIIKRLRANGRRLKGYKKVDANTKATIVFHASEWLRFRYGVMPIVSDVQAILKALETGYAKVPTVHVARATKQTEVSSYTKTHYGDSAIQTDYQRSTRSTLTVRASFADRYHLGFYEDLGFNTRNLVGLPWELLKYSFVVDWFVNVGDVIYANIPRPQYEELGGGVVTDLQTISVYSSASGLTATDPSVRTVTGSFSDQVFLRDREKRRFVPDTRSTLVIKDDFRLDRFIRATDAISVAIQWLHSIGFDKK